MKILIIVIIGCGVVGNFISIEIFRRINLNSKVSQRHLDVNQILMMKLIVDILNLIFQIPTIQPMSFFGSNFGCKIQVAFSYILPAYSAWILLFVSIERLNAVTLSKNLFTRIITSKKNQMINLGIILVVTVALYSPVWNVYYLPTQNFTLLKNGSVLAKNITNLAYCYITDDVGYIVYWINLIFAVLIPFVLLIVSSVLIIYSMRVLTNHFAKNISDNQIHNRREKRDLDYTLIILSLDIIFLVCNFPYKFLLTLTMIDYNYMIYFVLYYLYYLGYSINLLNYLVVNRSFRNIFISNFIKYEEN